MNNTYYKGKKEKNKHLTKEMYNKIQSEYNYYISSNNNELSKTEFKQYLANLIGTTLSNIYQIINDGLVTVLNYDLTERVEFSADLAWNKRTKKAIESNSSKRISAKPFIELALKELRSEYNINSVDEIINDLKLNRAEEIQGMATICTATFYNYVDTNKIENFSSDELPINAIIRKFTYIMMSIVKNNESFSVDKAIKESCIFN